MAKDLNDLIAEKHTKLPCVCCGESYGVNSFFTSQSRNAMTRQDMQGRTHSILCKACTNKIFEYFYKIFRSADKALYQYCAAFDVYYDTTLVDGMKEIDASKFIETYYALLAGDIKYSAKTFVDSIGAEIESPKVEKPKDEELTDEDNKNRREIIGIYHYDPFENEPIAVRKKLYNSLCTMIDESLREDFVRQMAALEIVRSFARIDEWTKTIDEWSKDPRKMVSQSKELKTLIDTKQKETDMVTKFSKDHGFAERYATSKSRGTGTLSATMRDMEEMDFDDGKVNYYDIKTSESMQQASDISMNSIMKQLSLQEADYVQMVKEQRERMVFLETELNRAKEELRLVYKAVKKQDLLKELATQLIKSGMTQDEVAQAIFAEIHYDDEAIKRVKGVTK